jgi:hypothetical protein
MLGVVFCLLLTRLYVRFDRLQKRLLLSDYFLIAGFWFAIAHSATDVLMFKYGILNNERSHEFPTFPQDPVEIVAALKVIMLIF